MAFIWRMAYPGFLAGLESEIEETGKLKQTLAAKSPF